MPWRGPQMPGEFPTLGFQVADWIEERCAIPDREMVGEPYLLTDEQLNFILNYYRLTPEGRFFYRRGGQLIRPQKWGKGPLSAALICAEAEGPVVPDGWNAAGEPVGKSWPTPLIQVTAVSEAQTDNVYSALLPMIELGALKGEIEDTGLGRINLPGGGKIEPVTASARSRLGQRVTFIVQDETHSWLKSNGGRALADNQRRNIAGMGGRWLETTNAFDPAEDSVAQNTYEQEGNSSVYIDDREAADSLSVRNKVERRKALKVVYGDSWTGRRNGEDGAVIPWVKLDRIDDDIIPLLARDPAQAERFFLNRKRAAEAAAFDYKTWKESTTDHQPEKGVLVVLGIDGARFVDALAVVATEVETGFQWPVGIWERPESAPDGYEHPMGEVDAAIEETLQEYDVWRVYVDPGSNTGNIDTLMEKWQGRWGEEVFIPWRMERPKQTAQAVVKFTDAIATGEVTNDGNELFHSHIRNAVRRKVTAKDEDGRPLHVISKDRPDSPRKIDAAAAAVLSWECRGDAIAEGAKKRKVSSVFIQGL
jgi:hypothetical protein